MTIYVDDAGVPATVGDPATGRRYRSRWCHLFSSEIDQTELHAFAARIGLRRAWFQPGKRLGQPDEHDPVKDHYDLTAGKRRHAIAAGAIAVSTDQAVALWQTKRDAVGNRTTAP
ncbi:MAG: DUF4031 domain-containing protein [Pseudonocardiaceae bacterium]